MGKVTATELIETRIDFVSFVDKGANGERFQIYKSADYKPEAEKEIKKSIDFDEKELSVFQKILDFFSSKRKDENELPETKNLNKEEDVMDKNILSIITSLKSCVDTLTTKVENLEKKIEKKIDEQEDDNGVSGDENDTRNTGTQETSSTDTDSGEDETGNGDSSDDEGSTESNDSNTEELQKQIAELTERVTKLGTTVESISKKRIPSNKIDEQEIEKDGGTDEVSFKGIF